ncbi:MAG TPA: hypothetical protein VGO04_29025 [Ensifer sp.]|jgi:hypothetical protein|uniref:hypothetical protein n=1 Tax=Ensifer sp. TaxID=1872086 RepID=UPI002E0EC27F|nr:hypothetical protein [Ensifer sp.]
MTTCKCHCGTSLRRQRVLDSNVDMGGGLEINGIDFVEVLDSLAPAGLAQKLLDVTFLKPDGVAALTEDNFAVTGGTRIKGIKVLSLALQPDGLTQRLTLNQAGDFSPYVLSLRQGPVNAAPPANMDRQLSSVSFSFKVECPSDFDCADPAQPMPRRPQGPPTDYLTRDFSGFRTMMLDRMSATMVDWSERNPADLGVTLIEVLADAADKASWFQDAVGTEAFFERTRFRQSLVRHARLLGYRPGEGCNARTAVAVTAGLDRDGAPDVIARGTRLLTRPEARGQGRPTVVAPDAELFEDMTRRGSIVFEALEPLKSLRVARNDAGFHDWGDEGCCLRKGATSAFLTKAPGELDLAAGDLLVLEERIPFGGSAEDPPDPTHRQVVRLSEDPAPASDPIFGLALTEVRWFAEDALRFALPIGTLNGTPMSVARGNVLLVDEGRTVDHGDPAPEDAIVLETLPAGGLLPDDGPGQTPRYRLAAEQVVRAAPFDPESARGASAASSLFPIAAPVAQVALVGDGELWTTVPDLLTSERFAPHVAVEPGTAPGAAYIRFGDGVLGRRPTDGATFVARIRHGGGLRGNVGAGAIAHIVTGDGSGIAALDNPVPAAGGTVPEPRTAVHVAAPQALRVSRRAVTAADYAEVAGRHPRVARAFARRRWTGSWHTVTLALDLVGGGEVDAAVEAELRAFIEDHRLAGHDLEFVSPVFVPLDIILFVCASPDAYASDINRDLLALFSDRDLPDGTRGLFHPDVLEFGADVALSPMIARAMRIDGVSWIGTTDENNVAVGHFARMDQPGVDYAAEAIVPIASAEIARLDNDPSRPENGRVRFIVGGGR